MNKLLYLLTVLFLLIINSSCEKEYDLILDELKELDKDSALDTLSIPLFVNTHLTGSYDVRRSIGFWWDHAQYTQQSSVWSRMFMVAVFDKETLEPWRSKEHGDYGHLNFNESTYLPEWNKYNFYFPHNNVGLDSLMSFVSDVPKENYVLFYTFRGNYCSYYLNGQPISEKYEKMYTEIGANVDSLKNYPNNYPYILLFKKDDPSSVQEAFYSEEITADNHGFLVLSTRLKNY